MKKVFFLIVSLILFGSSVFAQDHFTPVSYGTGANCNIWFRALLDGEALASSDIEVAAFVDDECRATTRLASYAFDNTAGLMQVLHDGIVTITFKMFDHANPDLGEYESSTTITTTAEEEVLGIDNQNNFDPVEIVFTTTVEPQHFLIEVSANPEEGGTVSGGGEIEEGQTCTVTATANEGYNFIEWTMNGTQVSTNATYSFIVTEAASLVANFEEASTPSTGYPWVPVEGDGSIMSIFAEIQLNGVTITDEADRWELGAFCGEECRGDQQGLGVGPNGLLMYLTAYGTTGDVLTFSLYDLANNEVHPGVCTTTVEYVSGGSAGAVWEPIVLNFVSAQTFTKDILAYSEGKGYYLIASPIEEVSPSEVTNMTSNNFDLYYFDQNDPDGLEWVNYHGGSAGEFNLLTGKGYLYANSGDVTLIFTGTPIEDDTYQVKLDKDASQNPNGGFEGWNLVGNPFGVPAYIGDRSFYRMKNDGSEIIEGSGAINVIEGIFVIAAEDGEYLTFSKENTANQGEKIVVNVLQDRNNVIDRAVVRLSEGNVLPKFMLHDNSTKLYIQQDNEEFAVVRSNDDNEIPVNFKAAKKGTYTISVSQENVNMQYLHLIDNKTGDDIDLLATPNYQFNANEGDSESRFTLSFKANNSVDVNENSNPINYCQNGRLTINGIEGEAELEVIDLFGRILSSTKFNGSYNDMIDATPGVYMIRLTTADKTYSQKIVVE